MSRPSIIGRWLASMIALNMALWGTAAVARGDKTKFDPVEAKLAIIEKYQLYTLLHDGDGKTRDSRAWADRIFSKDATFQVVWPDGTRLFADDPRGLVGREAIFRAFGSGAPENSPWAVRHILGMPVFDLLTPTEAWTRTIEHVLRGPKIQKSARPEAPPPVSAAIDSYVFHDRWRKESDGQWRKVETIVHCTLNCQPVTLGSGPASGKTP